MQKNLFIAGAALALAGCGAYFDQHPANVQPESIAVATVLAHDRLAAAAQPERAAAASEIPGRGEPKVVATPAPVPAVSAPPSAVVVQPRPTQRPVAATAQAPINLSREVVSQSLPPASVAKPRASSAPAASVTPPSATKAMVKSAEPTQASTAAVTSAPAAALPPPPPPPVQSSSAAEEITAIASTPAGPPPPPPATVPPAPPPPAAALVAPAPAASDTHCQAVARQRAEDAAASGLDPETQEIVRRGAYADCAAWNAAHPPP